MTDAVRWIQDKLWVDRLEATIEAHTLAAAQVRENCTIPGTSVRTAWLCRDKPSMKEALRAAGVPTAASTARRQRRAGPGLRRTRSASRSSSSRAAVPGAQDTTRVDDRGQLDQALASFGGQGVDSIAVEEFVEGHEGFYDTLSVDGQRRARLRLALLPQRARGDAHPLDLPAVRLDEPGRLGGGLPASCARWATGSIEALGHRHQRHAHGVVLRTEGTAVLRDRLPPAGCRRLGPLLGGQRHRPLPRVGERDRARHGRQPARRGSSPPASSRCGPSTTDRSPATPASTRSRTGTASG